MPTTSGPVAVGAPLTSIAPLIGGPLVDDLLRAAAAAEPDRCAVRAPGTELSYRELDARASRFAAALRASAGPGEVVALAAVLDPVFPTAFFGISRAGAIPALVNPLLREEGLAHVLRLCEARVAVVPPEVYRRLLAVRDTLPALRTILLTEPVPGAEVSTVDEMLATAPAGIPAVPGSPGDTACLQFTSGTTGPPKAVRLSHRNLLVNAAQTAAAHRLDGSSVLFDYLPTFHLMHLTISVAVAGTLVLWPGEDEAAAVDAAADAGATHFYSLPVRMSRLARNPRLPGLAVPGLRAFLCGGSALPPATTDALRRQFGVPVAQGYGLQETSPSTHFDDLGAPVVGSSGRPVAGTDCRIVAVGGTAVLPPGERGEIQVRGPQVMAGYLGRPDGADVDADGWFATGDVGYVDAGGRLFVVDRIKDVFKCDNWLVSPTEIERVLLRHPGVADCAVVDFPDELSGAVAYGLVVPARAGLDPGEVTAYLAERLPYYERPRHLDLVDTIPRSPTGKLARRELRERLVRAANGNPPQEKEPHVFTFINRFTVTGDVAEFEQALHTITEYMAAQPGFRSYQLYRSAADAKVYVETAVWADAAAHKAAISGEGFRGPVRRVLGLAEADAAPFELVTRTEAVAAS
ncbi:AMP-binding protein [Amycolatopsis samaneae]|uniref:AMP-binding protein n=1 Tax=Amycolatopsis samaneae TaxID=664691 RepID=A0ABW5GRY7_9PSEU